jgi:hypothetical protein
MMSDAATLHTHQITETVKIMGSKTSATFGPIDVRRLEAYRGKVVALDSVTGDVLGAEDDLEVLAQKMNESHPGREYFAYGVPTLKDFAHGRELQDGTR